MPEGWLTKLVSCEGGVVRNVPALAQGMQQPGSLIQGVNFEPALSGGYRRINGYMPFRNDAVPGTGAVLGVFVYRSGAIACRGQNIFKGDESSDWTQINTDTREPSNRYRAARYRWYSDVIVLVDGVNKPVKWDGTTFTVLTGAPVGAVDAHEFANHLFFAQGSQLTWSKPNDDTNYSATDGAGVVNVGFEIVGIKPWRGELFIFGRNAIKKLTGTSYANFAVSSVATNMGCVDANTINEFGGDLLFLAPDGLRTIAGTANVGDVQLNSVSRAVQDSITALTETYNTAGDITAVVVRSKSQYRLFYSYVDNDPLQCRGLLAGLRSSDGNLAWEFFDTSGFKLTCADSAYIGNREYVLHGGYDGFVYRQEQGFTFNGDGITSVLQTAHMAFDDPALRKTLYRLSASVELEGAITISVVPVLDMDDPDVVQPDPIELTGTKSGISVFDDGNTTFDADDNFDALPSSYISAYLEGSGNFVSFRFVTDAVVPCWTIKTMTLEYSLGGRS